jgi:hypothetical protein
MFQVLIIPLHSLLDPLTLPFRPCLREIVLSLILTPILPLILPGTCHGIQLILSGIIPRPFRLHRHPAIWVNHGFLQTTGSARSFLITLIRYLGYLQPLLQRKSPETKMSYQSLLKRRLYSSATLAST